MTFFTTLILLIMVAIIPVVNATTITVPDPPPKLASMPGSEQVSLKWLAPLNDGSSEILTYVIEYSDDGGSSWMPFKTKVSTITKGTVTDLTNGEKYSFRVSAVNKVGSSEPSMIVIETPRKQK